MSANPIPNIKRSTPRRLNPPLESAIQKNIYQYTKNKYRAKYKHLKCFGNPLSNIDLSHLPQRQRSRMINHFKAQGWEAGQPDFYVDQPNAAFINGEEKLFHGLRLEIKRDEKQNPFKWMPRKKIFKIENDGHFLEQAKYLATLQQTGYMALFGVGEKQCIDIIDWYLGNGKLSFEKFEFSGGRYVPEKFWIWRIK